MCVHSVGLLMALAEEWSAAHIHSATEALLAPRPAGSLQPGEGTMAEPQGCAMQGAPRGRTHRGPSSWEHDEHEDDEGAWDPQEGPRS